MTGVVDLPSPPFLSPSPFPSLPPLSPSLPPRYLKREAIRVERDKPLSKEHGGIQVLREGGGKGGRIVSDFNPTDSTD